MVEAEGCHRQDGEARLFDEEGVLVRAVGGAAVLDDAEPPGGDLLPDPEVEEDDAVGHVLLEAVAGQEVIAPLARDTAVTPRAFSQRKSRLSSARRMFSLGRAAKRASTVSKTTRLAPTESMA